MIKKALVFASVGVLAIACSATVVNPPVDNGEGGITKDGGREASPVADASKVCTAGDVATFMPTFLPPALTLGACTDSQADAYVDCLFDTLPDPATCKAFSKNAANAACLKCAGPNAAGPMISQGGGLVSLNNAGCIGVKDGNIAAGSCASKVQASTQCANAACDANCPVEQLAADGSNQATVDAELAALNACTAKATTGACKTYGDAAACADAEEADGGPAAACTGASGETFQDGAKRLTKIFCGGGVASDAGPG